MWFQLTVTVTHKAKITENIAQLTVQPDLKLKSCIAVIAIQLFLCEHLILN